MNEREQVRFLLERTYPLTEQASERTEQWFQSLSWWQRRKAMKTMRHKRNFVVSKDGTVKYR